MAFNGSGSFTLASGNPVVSGTVISSTTHNSTMSDIANNGLSNCITKDGQTTITQNIPLNSKRITGLGAATALTDAIQLTQVQDSSFINLAGVAGTDTITATLTPTPSAYASGQIFVFEPANANTGATTINISSLGAKSIHLRGAALTGGELIVGEPTIIRYNGTEFDLIQTPAATETAKGIVEKATTAESQAGTADKFPDAAGVKASITANESHELRLTVRSNDTTETLSASNMNQTQLVVIGASAITKTLPLLSAVVSGQLIAFDVNGGGGGVLTVVPQGADELSVDNVAAFDNFRLAEYGDYVLLLADTAAGRWRVLSDGTRGPYFEASRTGGAQTLGGAGVATKLQFNNEDTDSHGGYDPTTNYRFTPTMPGFYDVRCVAYFASGGGNNRYQAAIYKNGAQVVAASGFSVSQDANVHVSKEIYMNGTTDYLEIFGTGVDLNASFNSTNGSYFAAKRIK